MSPLLLRLPLALALLPAPAGATAIVKVRAGDHPGHGRVVFDWPLPTGYSAERQQERVLLRFASAAEFDLAAVRRPVRNLRHIEAEGQTASLEPTPGAGIRHFRLGGRVVVDLMDPGAGDQPPAPIRLASAGGLPALPPAEPEAAPAAAPPPMLAQALPPLTPRPGPSPFQPRSQQAQAMTLQPTMPAPAAEPAPPTPVRLEAGTGRLLTLNAPASTVMAADPRIARVQPSSPTSVFIMAVSNGRTTVIATDDRGRPVAEFDVSVFGGREQQAGGLAGLAPQQNTPPPPRPLNARAIESQIRSLPGAGQVRVRAAGRSLILSGTAANAEVARRAEMIARGMGNDDTEILNELAVLSSVQVNLRVRVAEISRDLTRQFGFNWSAIGSAGNFAFGLATGSVIFPASNLPGLPFGAVNHLQSSLAGAAAGGIIGNPQRLGAGYRAGSTDVNGIIDALAADNLITVLAEPNLTAQSGEVASFLAGGEFPIPVGARDNGITIEFKQYGVSLAFVPIVLGNDRLTLRVRPEVSELTDQGAINLPTLVGTLRIPALTVRRAETTVELGSGQSFAIAGLLQRNSIQQQDGVNGLTDLPVLGALFRSDRFQRRETELVIIVTPYLVQPVSEPGALQAPTDNFRPATSLERILRQRQLREGSAPVPPLPPQLGFRFQ